MPPTDGRAVTTYRPPGLTYFVSETPGSLRSPGATLFRPSGPICKSQAPKRHQRIAGGERSESPVEHAQEGAPEGERNSNTTASVDSHF